MHSILVTSTLDVLFVAACVVAGAALLRHAQTIRRAGANTATVLLCSGLVVWGGFHLVDLLLLLALPFFPGPDPAAGLMGLMHDEIRTGVEMVTAAFFLSGFVVMMHKLGRLLAELQSSADALESELGTRDQLEQELKSEAMTERMTRQARMSFLQGLSHELRTPLNGVLGLASLLANTELDKDQRRLLTTLEQSTQAVLARVNDLLDLSRLENQSVELRSQSFLPGDICHAVVALFEPLTAEKSVGLSIECHDGSDQPVIGDPVRLKQVLTHLVSNAVKFTPNGSVSISVSGRRVDHEHCELEFVVADTGIGLSDEDRERLSSPERLDASGKAGLGLIISWRLLRLMDGGLRFESAPDSGTRAIAHLRVQIEPETGEDA